MIIGTTKELKNHEYRVGLTPDNVSDYVAKGHTVYVETHAGEGANFSDDEYAAAGAIIADTPAEVFAKADMIVKVKEPEPHGSRMKRSSKPQNVRKERIVVFTLLTFTGDTHFLRSGKIF